MARSRALCLSARTIVAVATWSVTSIWMRSSLTQRTIRKASVRGVDRFPAASVATRRIR